MNRLRLDRLDLLRHGLSVRYLLNRLGDRLGNLLDGLDGLVHSLLEIRHGGRRARLRLHLTLLTTPLVLGMRMRMRVLMLVLANGLHGSLGMLGSLSRGVSGVAI